MEKNQINKIAVKDEGSQVENWKDELQIEALFPTLCFVIRTAADLNFQEVL